MGGRKRYGKTKSRGQTTGLVELDVPQHYREAVIEAERYLLGALLSGRIDYNAFIGITGTSDPNLFSHPLHRSIYVAYLKYYRRHRSLVGLEAYLSREVGGADEQEYLEELLHHVASEPTPVVSEMCRHAGRVILRYYHYRRLGAIGHGLRAKSMRLLASAEPISRFQEVAFWTLYRLKDMKKYGGVMRPLSDVLQQLLQEGISDKRIPTGTPLDEYLDGGLPACQLSVLAARPGTGKTMFALQIAYHASLLGHRVIFFSYEMTMRNLVRRLVQQVLQVSPGHLPSFVRTAEGKQAVAGFSNVLGELPLMFVDGVHQTPGAVRSDVLRFIQSQMANGVKNPGVDLIIVDYLQLMSADQGFHSVDFGRVVELDYITASLKAIAREFDASVLVLAQLNREAQFKRPSLSNLKDSGAIEQNADVVLLMYRDEEETAGSNDSDTEWVTVEIAKNRNGPVGFVNFVFDKCSLLFRPPEALADGQEPKPVGTS